MRFIRTGALLAIAVGGAGALILAAASITRGDARLAGGAALLLVLLAAGGAVGGAVFGATSRLRDAGSPGVAASWFLSLAVALAFSGFLARLLPGMLHLTGNAAWRAEVLSARPVAIALTMAAALLALLAANSTPSPRAESSTAFAPTQLLVVGTIVLLVVSMNAFLAEPARVPLAEDSATAARVVDYAWQEARNNPRSVDAQLAAGYASMYLDRYEESLPALQAAVRLDAGNAYTQNALGWTYNELERFEEALPHLEAASRIGPSMADASANLGWSYMRLERWEPAERAFRQSLRYRSRDAKTLRELAWVLYHRDKDSLALFETLRSLDLEPEDIWTRAFASKLYREKSRFDDALAHLDTAMSIDDSSATVWVYLGATRYAMGDSPAAKKAFDKAFHLDTAAFTRRPEEFRMWLASSQGLTGPAALRRFLPAQAGSSKSPQ